MIYLKTCDKRMNTRRVQTMSHMEKDMTALNRFHDLYYSPLPTTFIICDMFIQ